MRTSIVRAYALGIISGSFLTAATLTFTFPVKADVDRVVVAYAAQYAGAVCTTLDEYPTIDGVYGIGLSIMEDGLTAYQAGQVIGLSVLEVCPRHIALMQNFASAADQVA